MIRPKLDDEAIRDILVGGHSLNALARKYHRSKQALSQIRHGLSYADRCVDLPRLNSVSCAKCQHWTGNRCDLGHMDPLEEGLKFAQWCNNYREVRT